MPAEPILPVQPYEASAEEKEAVLEYARRHPELRHRELAWPARNVAEDGSNRASESTASVFQANRLAFGNRGRLGALRGFLLDQLSRPARVRVTYPVLSSGC